jgi:hypothetical protein
MDFYYFFFNFWKKTHLLSLNESKEYIWSASFKGIPSQQTRATTIHEVEHLWPWRFLTTTKIFSSRLPLRITHLARGHPVVVFPSFPVYIT